MGQKRNIAEMRQQRLRTSFGSLPLQPEHPQLSAWGLWGPRDELGTLNMLDEDNVKKAMQDVESGEVIVLK
jgi:hypothetical protein